MGARAGVRRRLAGVEGGLEFERDQWGGLCGVERGHEAGT